MAIKQEECLKIGGHCWKSLNAMMTDINDKTVFPVRFKRMCDHCGRIEFKTMEEMNHEED